MAIVELFSKRQKKLHGQIIDIYQYKVIPQGLRIQIIHVWFEIFGGPQNYTYHQACSDIYKNIVKTLCKEYGWFSLSSNRVQKSSLEELVDFFSECDTEKALDVIELSCNVLINCLNRSTAAIPYEISITPEIVENAIFEINARFQEHGIGYQFINGQIIKKDSEFIHSEMVIPAVNLLNEEVYKGAEDEFLSAHNHYRHGRYKEALNDCLKSFESVMKIICKKRKWDFSDSDNASKLITKCLQNNLIPDFWLSHFTALRSMLESSVPTCRNKLGGHGQGYELTHVPEHLMKYVLHMTAATLVFMVNAERSLR